MEGPSRTLFARSGDFHIAYQVLGDGAADLILVPAAFGHLETYWEEPRCAQFLRGLASFSRLAIFDKRGTGMSDRIDGVPTPHERMDDIRAVMDAIGSERAVLLGMSEGGAIAALFAATYPTAVSRLIALGSGAVGYVTPEQAELQIAGLVGRWGNGDVIAMGAPSVAHDDRIREWTGRMQRRSNTPGTMAALIRMNAAFDIRGVLGSITVPTLVLHRTGDLLYSIDKGRYMADHIPGARFVELQGTDHLPYYEEPERILGLIEEFVTGWRRPSQPVGDVDVDTWATLTLAELRVADLVRDGLTNPQIAERLFVSRGTVKTHISHILGKVGCATRAGIAVAAEARRPSVATDG